MGMFSAKQTDYIAKLNQLASGMLIVAANQAANFTAQAGYFYPLAANNLQVTLPAAPNQGDRVRLAPTSGGVTSVTILRNGSSINGAAADVTLTGSAVVLTVELTFLGGSVGWLELNGVAPNNSTVTAPRKNAIRGGDASTNPWQRGTSFTGLTNVAQYTADGWVLASNSGAVFNVAKTVNAPTVAQAGKLITECFDITVTTADTSITSGEYCIWQHKIEGYTWKRYAQRACAIRFWHAHSKVGTYCVAFRNGGFDRVLIVEYTQAVANAWEEAVIDLPASPAAGTWNYTNGLGCTVEFAGAVGTGLQLATVNAWATSGALSSPNQVNALDTVGNHLRFADIRFVLGAAVNGGEIETRDAQEELLIAQRYLPCFQAMSGVSGDTGGFGQNITGTQAILGFEFKVPVRAPTTGIVVTNLGSLYTRAADGTPSALTALVHRIGGLNSHEMTATVGATVLAAGNASKWGSNGAALAQILFTGAEL